MSVCYVKAGQCKNEVVIKVHQTGPSLASVEVETTCEHIKKFAEELKNIKVGEEMTLPICETQVYKTASKYLCRTSCVVPSAILKAIEVQFKIFEPVNASIEFIEL